MKRLDYRRTFILSMIVLASGIAVSVPGDDSSESFGTVLIALGGLLLISSMAKKYRGQK